MRNTMMALSFIGNKRDYLVKKFIVNLKKKVRERKDLVLREQNERLIKQFLKKKSYNTEFQKAKVISQLENKLKEKEKVKPPNTRDLMEKIKEGIKKKH